MLKRFFALALLAIAIGGCDNESAPLQFRIDNPTNAPITLTIDGKDYPVPAHDDVPVRLSPGEHHLRSERLGDVRVIVYARGRGGIINPTLGDYVLVNKIYVTDEDKLKNFGSLNARITLGGVTFKGPFHQTHALFIDKEWNFGAHEPFPETLSAHVDGTGGRIMSKIFTAADFIAYVEENNGQPGAYLKQNPSGFVQPVYALEPMPAQLPPLHAEYEAHAGALRAVYARYLKAVTAEEQLKLQKDYFQAQTDFTHATATLGSSLPVNANEGYNDFVGALSQLMGSSAVVPPQQ